MILSISALNNNLGGCSIEQEGEDFFIVGADAVRKKLGNPNGEVEVLLHSRNIGLDASGNRRASITVSDALKYSLFFVLYQYNSTASYTINVNGGTWKQISGWHPQDSNYVASFAVTPNVYTVSIEVFANNALIIGIY